MIARLFNSDVQASILAASYLRVSLLQHFRPIKHRTCGQKKSNQREHKGKVGMGLEGQEDIQAGSKNADDEIEDVPVHARPAFTISFSKHFV